MKYLQFSRITIIACISLVFFSCKKDEHKPVDMPATIEVENVLQSQPLVQSGMLKGPEASGLTMPGQSFSIRFSAAKGETISFATMYGWSSDMFFATENPGIPVYDDGGKPIIGDVSGFIKLWDNGTRINQVPGPAVIRPGVAESKPIEEVKLTDAQGNKYIAASQLAKAVLAYEGNSYFTLTVTNMSGGTANQTPFSPGVWAVSYIVGGNLLNPAPLYTKGQPTANGLTAIAEGGNNVPLSTYISSKTGIFTPLSPVLVVVYNGIENPFYKIGEKDRDQGLKNLAQQGDAEVLAAYLKGKKGIKAVYVLPAPNTKVLLPVIDGQRGGFVSQVLSVAKNDRLAIATMYGFSNDWFFASSGDGVDATMTGDISGTIGLYDNGTAIDQFPGAGITQFNLAGTPLVESKPIARVPNPNPFTTLPPLTNMIKVTLK